MAGLAAMVEASEKVSAGWVAPVGVASAKMPEQMAPPSELTQAASRLASAYNLPDSTVALLGRLVAGETPALLSASIPALRNALRRPAALVCEEPTWSMAVANGASAQAAATVVTSLMVTAVELLSEPQSPSAVTSGGVLALTRELSLELGPHGVTVNTVVPGWILTERSTREWERMSERARRDVLAEISLGRPGRPGEVAGAVLFLASDASSYVSGSTIDVNGGLWMS